MMQTIQLILKTGVISFMHKMLYFFFLSFNFGVKNDPDVSV